ncbi:MAG: M28 family metallopeptidase [Pyrinomonadaceae bacterium]
MLGNLWKKILLVSILILTLSVTAFVLRMPGNVVSTEEEIAVDLKTVPCEDDKRLEGVKKLFLKMGAGDEDLSIENFDKIENLVLVIKGKTDDTVIIGAHYDKVEEGCGAIDNWSGIVVLANLYRSLKDVKTEKTYKFVAFDKEEKGLLGSRAMAKEIKDEDLQKYCAMINFDSFGFSYPQAMGNASDGDLIKLGKEVAKDFDFSLSHYPIPEATADSRSFNDRKIPAATFHGISSNWKDYLHTSRDKLENVKPASVYLGYRFGLKMLARIDQAPCQAFR